MQGRKKNASPDTMLLEADPGPGPWFYRVTAIDVHDNEGPASDLLAKFGIEIALFAWSIGKHYFTTRNFLLLMRKLFF